MSKDVRLFH